MSGPRPKLCRFCKKTWSTKLCDFPVEKNGRRTTCSAPMCDACSAAQGPNIDYCPPHERNKVKIMEARLRSKKGQTDGTEAAG